MKRILIYCLFIITLISCGSSSKKKAVISSSKYRATTKTNQKKNPDYKKINSIVSYAKTFNGTRYKFGGTTKKGMDCSGLVYTSFKKENIILPRSSKTMATQGTSVSLKKVTIGDLLFFKTNKRKNVISHVGLVIETKGSIKFIHSSTSKGVIVSSLDETYWNKCFAGARRIL